MKKDLERREILNERQRLGDRGRSLRESRGLFERHHWRKKNGYGRSVDTTDKTGTCTARKEGRGRRSHLGLVAEI